MPLPGSLHLPRLLIALASLIPLLFALVRFGYAPLVISHDSAIGWQTWRSMQAGADWNQIAWPDPDDIARAKPGYLVRWTPGQYLQLGWLKGIEIPLGATAIVTSQLGTWSLGFGSWPLCLALGTGDRGAVLVALALAATWHTLYAFGFYIGGEIIQLALCPWIVLAAWLTSTRCAWQLVILPLLFLLGSYSKLSFTINAAALLLFPWLEACRAAGWNRTVLALAGLQLAELDRPDQVICLSDIMHAPLVAHARVLLRPDGSVVWRRRAPHLVLMLPVGALSTDTLARFVDYVPADWRVIQAGTLQFWSAPAAGYPAS